MSDESLEEVLSKLTKICFHLSLVLLFSCSLAQIDPTLPNIGPHEPSTHRIEHSHMGEKTHTDNRGSSKSFSSSRFGYKIQINQQKMLELDHKIKDL